MSDIKAFFHEWCSKQRMEPIFETRPTGNSFAVVSKENALLVLCLIIH